MVLGIFSLLPLGAQNVVEGVVVESVAKTPVAGSTVQVIWTKPLTGTYLIQGENDQGPKAETDDAGRFRLEIPAPSEFRFKVTKEGYPPLDGASAPRFQLKEKESKRDITLTLLAECLIEGRVVDPETDQPVAGLAVDAYEKLPIRATSASFMHAKHTTTGKDGSYKLDSLRPGTYRVTVGPSRYPSARVAADDTERPPFYPRVFYPGDEQEAAAAQLDLLPGARIGGIDFRLRKAKSYRIRGKLERSDGAPLNGNVKFMQEENHQGYKRSYGGGRSLPAQSSFEFEPVQPGTYRLLAWIDAPQRSDQVYGRLDVTLADRDVDNAVMVLHRGVTVTGVLHSEGSPPGKDDPLWEATEKDISIYIKRQNLFVWGESPVPVTRGDGRWTVEGAQPEVAMVSVQNLPPGYAVTSMKYNASDAVIGRIELTPGAMVHEIAITVDRVSNSVRGAVTRDGKPSPGHHVLLVRDPAPEDWAEWQIKSKQSDDRGAYVFDTLEPGWYRLAVSSNASDHASAMGNIASGNYKRVEVGKTTNATVNLEIR